METELIYGLDLTDDKNESFIKTLKRNSFFFKDVESNGYAGFPSNEMYPFKLGIYIIDDNEKYTAGIWYDVFKDRLSQYISEEFDKLVGEVISEFFTEKDKQDTLAAFNWLNNQLKTKEPNFYFIEYKKKVDIDSKSS